MAESSLPSVIESINAIVKDVANANIDTERHFVLFLRSWWSKYYNRPLKDPMLDSYTVEELYYEFRDKIERENAEERRAEEERDRIEAEKEQESLDWAEQEEAKELAELKKKQEDEAWMKEQLKKEKKLRGEDFGEDLSLNAVDI